MGRGRGDRRAVGLAGAVLADHEQQFAAVFGPGRSSRPASEDSGHARTLMMAEHVPWVDGSISRQILAETLQMTLFGGKPGEYAVINFEGVGGDIAYIGHGICAYLDAVRIKGVKPCRLIHLPAGVVDDIRNACKLADTLPLLQAALEDAS